MDSFVAFTKMTGVMNLNLTHSPAKLLHPPHRGGALKLRSEIFVPCHLCESCKKRSQCKINCTNKISAFAGTGFAGVTTVDTFYESSKFVLTSWSWTLK